MGESNLRGSDPKPGAWPMGYEDTCKCELNVRTKRVQYDWNNYKFYKNLINLEILIINEICNRKKIIDWE